ncbi:ABC-type transport, permease protein [Lunatimonas lonarensis]|uniref:ABC-type transport, permease protein n=1 Tax=Lunatimonas lonarensis TaxID=1232681 RepID=R7ZKV5_9BACT|nr:ABC transporter permease subunit [Lunatimonas lonarensis]EON74731.1 ABC-type transport, permease protein [Lunatimonas lonarensis]
MKWLNEVNLPLKTTFLQQVWNRWAAKDRAIDNRPPLPFWVIVRKEVSDHIHSWRLIILMGVIVLACLGSLITGLLHFNDFVKVTDPEDAFFFLKLFSASGSGLPSFVVFISFLGPLLGIGLGFDAVNSEVSKGTLARVLSQPIFRDQWLNAKFAAGLLVVAVLLGSLTFLFVGLGILRIGIPPTPEEFLRILIFILVSVCYVGFWLNLSILFSVRFRQAATSALAVIAVWLFFTVFYGIIVNLIGSAIAPSDYAHPQQIIQYQQFMTNLMRVVPSQLYSDATTTLLMPSVRSLGPLSSEQVVGALPSPLPLGQSVLLVWAQLTALLAATAVCFGLAYYAFMRREIRSR